MHIPPPRRRAPLGLGHRPAPRRHRHRDQPRRRQNPAQPRATTRRSRLNVQSAVGRDGKIAAKPYS